MESARSDPNLNLEDYSISQLTLDEVRLNPDLNFNPDLGYNVDLDFNTDLRFKLIACLLLNMTTHS
jgi:hypothetical protein